MGDFGEDMRALVREEVRAELKEINTNILKEQFKELFDRFEEVEIYERPALTTKEVSKLCKLSVQTVRASGISYTQTSKKSGRRYKREDVLDWLFNQNKSLSNTQIEQLIRKKAV